MAEYGIFSESAGGCIAAQMYSAEEAEAERQRLVVEDGEELADLSVAELCGEHEEQPRDGCEDCAAEDDEDVVEEEGGGE